MDSIVIWSKIQLRTRIPMVSPIFHARVVCGRHQIRGNARGPTEQTAMIIKDFRKYHWIFSSAKRGGGVAASRNSPQCLHFIASSWISLAQKGHFFIIISLGRTLRLTGSRIYWRSGGVDCYGCGIPRSLKIFFAKLSSISLWRGTVLAFFSLRFT